jgi:hypothetical protein
MSLLGHVRADTSLGQYMMQLLETFQVHTGIGGNPLQQIIYQDYVDAPWMETLREFLHTTSSRIRLPNLAVLKPLRQGDQCLMTFFVKSQQFNSTELKLINNCRLYLQVNYISEVVTSDGTAILNAAYHGSQGENLEPDLWIISKSKITWPYQPRPNDKAWAVWKRSINMLTMHPSRKLLEPLRQWYSNFSEQRQWKFLINQDNIYQTSEHGWIIFYKSPSSTRRLQTYNCTNTIVNSLPDGITPETPWGTSINSANDSSTYY